MNIKRKEAAVKKFSGDEFKEGTALEDALAAAEYKPDEITEIAETIREAWAAGPDNPPAPPVLPVAPTPGKKVPSVVFFEEWQCTVEQKETGKVGVKMKKVRDNVRITDYQATVLNAGVINGGNTGLVTLYCPAGHEGDIRPEY